jgi:hypothetical protein
MEPEGSLPCSQEPLRWPRDTLYPQKLALTSTTSGGRSVGIVRLPTKGHGVFSNISKYVASLSVWKSTIPALCIAYRLNSNGMANDSSYRDSKICGQYYLLVEGAYSIFNVEVKPSK